MANKSYISLAMLPLEDLSNFLQKVKGFNGGNIPANDTKKVDGIEGTKIAVAALDGNGDLVSDRNTVRNALQLGGVEASQYVTTSSASSLLSDTYEVAISSASEIKALRDELYQIKSDLTKKGMISNIPCYNGFIDPFRDGDIRYDNSNATFIAQADSRNSINDITVLDVTPFIVGEYIVVADLTKSQIAKISNIQGNRIFLDTTLDGPLSDVTAITRSVGSYNKGAFVFGNKVGSVLSSDIKKCIVKDWKVRKRVREITRSNSGFASTVTVPISMPGVLREVTASLACTGAPGSIGCRVYVATGTDYNLIAESEMLGNEYGTLSLRDLTFKFNDEVNLIAGNDYIFTLYSTYGDDNNKWFIGGYDEACLEDIHKDCYEFLDGAFVKATDDSDMFICLGVSEVMEDAMKYEQKGLYTCHSKLDAINMATRVRCELRVNREGKFKIVPNPSSLVPSDTRNLELVNEDHRDYGALGIFQPGTKVAIGNTFATVGSHVTSNTIFKLDKAVYGPGDEVVNRIGYKVVVKAVRTGFVPTNTNNPVQVEEAVVVELPLVAVIAGGGNSDSSYRLIFEGELKIDSTTNYKLEKFNEIQTQIYWESLGVPASSMNTYEELAGKILEVVVSTDNAYNTK